MNKKEVGKAIDKRLEMRCKKCNSTQVYVRIKEGSIVCRGCGNIDPNEDQKNA